MRYVGHGAVALTSADKDGYQICLGLRQGG